MNNSKIIFVQFILICFILISFGDVLAQSPVPAGAKLEKLATGYKQPEGPVWIDSLGLLFSDIRANTIFRWSPADGLVTPYLVPSDSSNGLTLDLRGRLILTQMAKRRVARQDSDGTITPLASMYNGKKFNSPNDLVVKSDGSIFFTDPDFNTPTGQNKEMVFKGIFRISPFGGVYALDSTSFPANMNYSEPNGICFSPDESKLYVNDSPVGKIYVWDVVNDSTIDGKRIFYTIPLAGYADGMKVDPDGNLYCTGPKGVWIISSAGSFLDTIGMTINPSNCAWGDADRKTLYITAGNSQSQDPKVGLYRIRLAGATDVKDHGFLPSKTFELINNYPNPFNPSTTIEYKTSKSGFLNMKVYDTLGREVATLVNEYKLPGTHLVQWDASDLPGGAYFCRLRDGKSGQQTKKLLLLK